MNRQGPQRSVPVWIRGWAVAAYAVVAFIQVWALWDNLVDREWVLAVCFGLTSLIFFGLAGFLLWLRIRGTGSRQT